MARMCPSAIPAYSGNPAQYDVVVNGCPFDFVQFGNPSYAQRAQKCYPNAQLHLIEGGAHGFSKKHDAIAMGYLKEFLFQK